MRIAVYNLYWTTYGGGEQVAGAIAEVFSRDHEVDVLGPEPVDVARMQARLGVDLSRCGFRQVDDDLTASVASADYDVLVTTTYLSQCVNRAPLGLYYAHFPEEGRSAAETRRAAVRERVVPLLDRAPSLPGRVRVVRDSMAAKIKDRSFLSGYQSIIANSEFTAGWIEQFWGVRPDVLYPGVRMLPALQKQPLIASVGRFFAPSFGHCKKQLDLVLAFRKLHRSGAAEGWEYHLVGGCDHKNREYFNDVRRAATGLPVHVHLNAPGSVVEELLGSASLFWHGGGYGEDLALNPHRAEHFGIAVVEAMSTGAVPMVFAGGGPAEIVRDDVDGVHWRTPAELVRAASELIADAPRRETLAVSASQRAREFSTDVFADHLRALLDACLTRARTPAVFTDPI
jgi:glycosyltransferase involved in cell wall biosynthesis